MLATKLRKINRSIGFKIVSFLVLLIIIFITVVLVFKLVDRQENLESVVQKDFLKSNKMYNIYQESLYELMSVLSNNNESASSKSTLDKLKNTNGMFFYIEDENNSLSNIDNYDDKFFDELPTNMKYKDHNLVITPNLERINDYYPYNFYLQMSDNYNVDFDNIKFAIGFSYEYLGVLVNEWSQVRAYCVKIIILLFIMSVAGMINFIFLIINAGKVPDDEEIHLNWFDKLATDINILFILITIFFAVCGLDYLNLYNYFVRYIVATILTASLAIIIILILSLIRHIKNNSLITHSLIYMILYKIWTVMKSIFYSGSFMFKVIFLLFIFTFSCVIGTVAFPLLIPIVIIEMYFVYKNVKKFEKLKSSVKKVREGNLKEKVYIKGNSEIAKLQNDINYIAEGLNNAVDEKLKSERFKTELISNVSHDLKTPLTSIINYVDLLKKEGLSSENSVKYLDILDRKSQRLKNLVEDLVEASKATTGNIKASFEKIEIQSFIEQVLGELDEKINESSLTFKINMPKEKLYVSADGKLLYRVVENLILNVLKYSYPSSRVYIDISERNDNCVLSIKNISSYELNVNPDELLQRFARGDESRNTEGNGLGLSIAKSFIELQKGKFNIEIDGDLFKAVVVLNIYKYEPEN